MAKVESFKDYRAACGNAGYIIKFEDGYGLVICAYSGAMSGFIEGKTCDTCPYSNSCLLLDSSVNEYEYVCGWDEADEKLYFYGCDVPAPSDPLDEMEL